MKYPVPVRVMKCLGHGFEKRGGLARDQRFLTNELSQVRTLDVVHREVLLPFVLPDLVNGDYMGMLKAGDRLRLGAKALHKFVTRELAKEQHLHRDDAVQADLPLLVHNAHPSARNFLEQFVVSKTMEGRILDFWFRSFRRRHSGLGSAGPGRGSPGGLTDAHGDETAWAKPLRSVGGQLRAAFFTCPVPCHNTTEASLLPCSDPKELEGNSRFLRRGSS